jgi:alpha-1,2-glucosyltransferase
MVVAEKKEKAMSPDDQDQSLIFDAHSALNISLFPPLFFFSGLYYTDVASTLVVLMNYSAFLQRSLQRKRGSWKARDEFISVVLGIVAISFRQTNIFWVAVFPAGLTVVDTLKSNVGPSARSPTWTPSEILTQSWRSGQIYDPSVADASLKEYILTSFTVVLAAMRMPVVLLKALLPCLSLLGLFAGFVAWNGGVVLGKSVLRCSSISY